MSNQFKNQMREVMSTAHRIFALTSESWSVCVKRAWANRNVKVAMKVMVVRFSYLKTTGEVREAQGTLLDSIVPPTKGTDRKKNEDVQCYFDVEAEGWRSFRKSNLIGICNE